MKTEYFFERSIPEPNTGCWLWLGWVDKDGYGTIRGRPAHRKSYEAHKGAIPEGKIVLHSCDQPGCVNPDHLRCGSHQENSDDRVMRGRAAGPRGVDHGSSKLDDYDVLKIRADQRSARQIAAQYGVHKSTVCRIRSRQLWPHVE